MLNLMAFGVNSSFPARGENSVSGENSARKLGKNSVSIHLFRLGAKLDVNSSFPARAIVEELAWSVRKWTELRARSASGIA